jgi:hypothetical protein
MRYLLISLLFLILVLAPSVYGLYLTFKASIILGFILAVVEPGPAIIGWIGIFGHPEASKKIAEFLHLTF